MCASLGRRLKEWLLFPAKSAPVAPGIATSAVLKGKECLSV